MKLPKRIPAVLALLALVLAAACGDDAENTTPAAAPDAGDDAAFPITLDNAGRPVRLERRPERIVSLAPTATEMLFAVDAGAQVVAVDDQSNFPAGVPTTKLSGFTPNIEAIAAFEPDLVVTSDDREELVTKLTTLQIPVLLTPIAANLDETYAELEQVGAATGHIAEAAAVVAGMRSEIDALVDSLPERDRPATYFHELDPTLYTATSKTFIGQIYALAGLTNIADAADDGSGYPQLTPEALISANPDIIFLADTKGGSGQDAASVAARPGFGSLAAVREGRVVKLDDDIASRWGPRVVDLLRLVTQSVAKLDSSVPVS